jgi:hypothetical protein
MSEPVGVAPALERAPAPPSLSEMQSGLGSVNLSDENGSGHAGSASSDSAHSGSGHAEHEPADPPPPAPVESPVFAVPSYGGEANVDDAAEIARQLANLSPRAAKAVAAAAKATTEEEREAALAAIEAEDETVNRGLLMRFLGSVDS